LFADVVLQWRDLQRVQDLAKHRRSLALNQKRYAELLLDVGELQAAREKVEEAVDAYSELCEDLDYPSDFRKLSAAYAVLCEILVAQGECIHASEICERVVSIQRELYPRESFPRGHRDLAVALQNLAWLLMLNHDVHGAVARASEAVDIWRGLGDSLETADTYDFVVSLQHLAAAHLRAGNLSKASATIEEALSGLEPASVELHKSILEAKISAQLYKNLARIRLAEGRDKAALEAGELAHKILASIFSQKGFSEFHPEFAASWRAIGRIWYATDRVHQACDAAATAAEMDQRFLESYMVGLSEAEALNFVAEAATGRNLLISIWRRTSRPMDALYELLWRQRGMVQRVAHFRQRQLRRGKSVKSQEILDKHRAVSRQITDLLFRNRLMTDTDQIIELTRERESLERELSRELNDRGAGSMEDHGSPNDLKRQLRNSEAFVDVFYYVDFPPSSVAQGIQRPFGAARYAAFVIQANHECAFVDLGDAEDIDAAIGAFRHAIVNHNIRPDGGSEVRDRVWSPIEKRLGAEVQTVYICADGGLTRVPWSALPSKDGRSPLLVDYAVAVVPSGAFLSDQLSCPYEPTDANNRCLLVGDVAFSGTPKSFFAEFEPASRGVAHGIRIYNWSPLPGTREELEAIAAVDQAPSVVTLRDVEANTTLVTRELQLARWAHIATHGFFAAREFRSATQLEPREMLDSDLLTPIRERATPTARNPWLLSGLVLAGANTDGPHPAQSASNGILTAEELAFLSMDDLELVVLSACDTGIGDVAGGEGVLGLQRAFHTAGARNVIASLWQIDDQATVALMQLFYRKLWQGGETPLEALRAAQLAVARAPQLMSKERTERGIDFSKTSPLVDVHAASGAPSVAPINLWGAFVLSGAAR
jgi:CHAT domain-containing protein